MQVFSFQDNMIDVREDCWYAHFFRGGELFVVYQDCAFKVNTNLETWTEAVQYGLDNGISKEQLVQTAQF